MTRKEELSWMDMLRQPATPTQPKSTLQVKQPPQQATSHKELPAPTTTTQQVAKSVSTPTFSHITKEQPPPVSVSQKAPSSDPPATAVPPLKHQGSVTALNVSGSGKEPPASSASAASGLTWADALAVTAKPAAGGSGSLVHGSGSGGAGGKDTSEQSWMEFLNNTNENASMNWMEALRKPMPAPAPSESTKVSSYLKNTIGKNSKKDGGELGAYFGIDSKRKADDDDGHDGDEGSTIKKKDKDRSATNAASVRPAKAAIPEPQELREEGAILVLENNTYVVRAATPEKLVETLTSESRADLPFTNTFMLTFRAFVSPIALYRLLMQRFNLPPPATTHPSEIEHWKARVSTPTRLRVFIVIKMWVTFHWTDFEKDVELLAAVRELPKKLREVGMGSPAEMLTKLLEKKSQPLTGPTWGGGNELMPVATSPPPKPLLSLSAWPSVGRPDFLKLPPEELARQLTLIEHDLFRVIPPWELLGMGWMKSDKTVRAPNILANISRFNYVAQWVTTEVVSSATLKECQACIEHMIRLMEECYNLQNYCSTLEVISGLEQTPVWRLKEVWASVNPKLRKSLEEKAKKFRSDKNWKKHRKLVQTAIPPCIPYLGMYLTDLVFADEVPREREGYVNFDKYRILARIIHELQLHQRTLYNLEPLPFLRAWWTSLRLVDEAAAYERSYNLVPRGGTQRAERRGSNSLAIRKATPPMAPARIPSEQSPSVTFAQLRNTFPFMVKDTILTLFPPEKFTFSSWRAIDSHGVVYGWSDEVEIYLAQNETDTVVIHAALNATKSDIFAVERQVRLYDISAGDNRALRAAIIALVASPEVHTVAEEKGVEMILVKEVSVPMEEVEPMPHVMVDTLVRQAETAAAAAAQPVVSPRGGYSSLTQFFATCNLGEDAANYLKAFQRECIIAEDLPFLSMEVLTEMGVKMGHAMKMMKIIGQLSRD